MHVRENRGARVKAEVESLGATVATAQEDLAPESDAGNLP